MATDAISLDAVRAVGLYHQIAKHKIGKFAPGPSQLSWASAPSSVRKYNGCECIELPLRTLQLDTLPSFRQAFEEDVPSSPLNLQSLSLLFYNSLALSERRFGRLQPRTFEH